MSNETENAYKEIFKVLNKHKEVIVFDLDRLKTESEHHLFGVKLKETYTFLLDPKIIKSLHYQRLKGDMVICMWGEKHRRTVSWSDDGTQPEDELLLCLEYPTGAYIFGQDYPEKFFQKFFLELKSYKPKYIDSHNHSLYFSMDNAYKIFNRYDSIMEKYHEENKKDFKLRKIKKMKDELKKLEQK